MNVVGGDVQELTLQGRSFAVAAGSDPTIDLGGAENRVESNGGGRGQRLVQSFRPWSIDNIVIQINDARGDREWLDGLVRRGEFFGVSIALVDGTIYSGAGTIIGPIATSARSSIATLSLAGQNRPGAPGLIPTTGAVTTTRRRRNPNDTSPPPTTPFGRI